MSNQAHGKLTALKELKRSYLRQMFPQDGEKVPRIRFDGFSGAWEKRKLGEVADMYDNLRIPVAESLRELGSTPYYGANGIQGYVKGYTHDGEFVLIAEDGASDIANYPVRYAAGQMWVNNHAHVLQGKLGETDTLCLSYIMSVVNYQPFLVGGTRAKLNGGVLKEIPVSIPALNEQKKLAAFFHTLDNLIALHS